MIKNNIARSLIVFFMMSCSNTGYLKKPDNLISENKMESILYDATIMAALENSSALKPEFKPIIGKPYLFHKYGIDSLQLVESESYYSKNHRIYLKIHLNVLNRIEKTRDSLNELDKSSRAVQK